MSGREDRFFTFKVDDWVNDLLTRFKFQVQMCADRLGHFIENHALTVHAQELETLDAEQRRVFKANLRTDVTAITQSLSQFLDDSLHTHGDILSKYLKEQVFFVPPTAILAISPIEVPIPVKRKEETIADTKRAQESTKMDTEAQKDDANAPKNATSLKTVLTQIHKTEYFLSRLKQLHDENEQYIQVLQSILHSLLQLDEMTKANDTESAIQQIFQTLQSSMKLLYKIQGELQQRGISANINISTDPTEAVPVETGE